MSTQTLILTQGYQPHDIVDWKDAVVRMFSGKIEVVAQYDEILTVIGRNHLATFPELRRALRQVVGTDAESITIKVPAVAVLRHKVRSFKTGTKYSKKNVCLRDHFTCFPAGTRVLMASGQPRPIEGVRVGDRVIDAYGQPQTVLRTGSKVAENLGYLKSKRSFEKTLVTVDHPFLTSLGEFVPVEHMPEYLVVPRQVQYNRLPDRQLVVSDYLPRAQWFRLRDGRIYWTRRGHERGLPVVIPTSCDLAYVLGLYCAEGSSDATVHWSFSMDEQDTLASSVVDYLGRLGLNPAVDLHPEKDTCIVRASSKALGIVIRAWCGVYSNGKHTPWEQIGPHHEAYLRGLFRGDSYIRKDKIVLSLTSSDLIFGAEAMLWGLGIHPSVQYTRRPGKKPVWSLVLQGRNFSEFSQLLGNAIPTGRATYGDDTFVYRKFQSLEPSDLSLLVYNLEVGGTNSYVANGYSVHNCQYCGTQLPLSQLEVEHVVPRDQGGKTTWTNIVMACTKCNSFKANRTPEQAGMTLLSVPVQPKTLPLFGPTIDVDQAPKEWLPFLLVA